MTLLRELIEIPERIQKGDFVLRLSEGVNRPEETLRNYVVTPELVRCFDQALTFIRSAVEGRTSKATYLHGSFGAGKSHFMAVLHLILRGDPHARGIPELAPVVQKHNAWIDGRKFLLVPYHMINAHDMESGVLGGYVEFVRRTHPDAPIPPVYMSAAIISQAESERRSYGDDAFFKRLNAGRSGEGGWGDLESAWDADAFEAAAAAPPDSEPHLRLVSALLETVASSHAEVISQRGGNFVRFDRGLSVMSRHAAGLGYDAVILFLDELILWLAMNSADHGFVKREAAKLTNLVEAQTADRPVPLVSFVARQRDLRELVGDHVPGAERLSFSDSLDWQQGRFDEIRLEDRNLPLIAERRVLKPKSQAARLELDAAFEQTAKVRESVLNVLLTSEGDRAMFRRVYPFSLALVQTLVGVSSVLQRERTALKVMMQLLVDQRETLRVGDVVPVGDLFDQIAHGDEAVSPAMAIHFENAKRLYHQKLLPQLEKQHNLRFDDVEALPYDDPKRTAFRADDRLVKTLLLAALVPQVESLRGLNAERLAALNHGTIKSPIAGRESQEVLRRVRNWVAGGVGEIRIGEEANPSITIQLSGVDTESILVQARREDNPGNRVRRVRQMLFERLGVEGEGEFEQRYDFLWRNTRRGCTVLFRNVRELGDSSFENDAEQDWKLIIDFPFDEPGHGPRDDLSKIQAYREAHPEGAKTICWVPAFFSADAQKDLGLLVVLEHVLAGERFGQYAAQLSPQDRQAAKVSLESQRNQLRQRVLNHLDAAYGLDATAPGSLDTVHDLGPGEHYVSLCSGFEPRPPAAATLKQAMEGLLDQALTHEFPSAPQFETEAKSLNFKKVYEVVEEAAATPDGRLPVDKSLRGLVRAIGVPLLLGEMGLDATHFVLGQHWKQHFTRKASEAGGQVTVKQLRKWIDSPRPMGLPREAANLVILAYAAQTAQSFFQHGTAVEPTLQNVPDNLEVRQAALPAEPVWAEAVKRAGDIFGVAASPLRSVANVTALVEKVEAKAAAARSPARSYASRLREDLKRLGLPAEGHDRLATTEASLALLDKLASMKGNGVVEALAASPLATSATAMGGVVGKAGELDGLLAGASWELLDVLRDLAAGGDAEAASALSGLTTAMSSDEHAAALGPALKAAQAVALRLVTGKVPPKVVPEVVVPEEVVVPDTTHVKRVIPPGSVILSRGAEGGLPLPDALRRLEEIASSLKPGQTAMVDLAWTVAEAAAP